VPKRTRNQPSNDRREIVTPQPPDHRAAWQPQDHDLRAGGYPGFYKTFTENVTPPSRLLHPSVIDWGTSGSDRARPFLRFSARTFAIRVGSGATASKQVETGVCAPSACVSTSDQAQPLGSFSARGVSGPRSHERASDQVAFC